MDDPQSLDDTYLQWRHNAEKTIGELRAKGEQVNKISIKISQLIIWCELKGIKPDSEARKEYASFLAAQRYN